MILSSDEMLAIVAAGAGSVALTAAIVICKLCPVCPLYRVGWGRWDSEDSMDLEKCKSQRAHYEEIPRLPNGAPAPLTPSAALLASTPAPARPPPPITPAKRLRSQHCSTQSDYGSSPASSPPHHKSKAAAFAFPSEASLDDGEAPPIQLDFSLAYDPETEKLGVGVKEARGVPRLINGSQPDSFLRLLLVKDLRKGWTRRRCDVSIEELRRSDSGYQVEEIRTPLVRHTQCPRWDDFYQLELKEREGKTAVLKFALYTMDRSGREALRAQAHKSLNKLELSPAQEHFTCRLKEHRPDVGDVTLILSFLPTAERLSLKVERGGGFKLETAGTEPPSTYVKAALLYRGKAVTKERTTVRGRERNPRWSETLTFDLSPERLEKSALLVSVFHKEEVSPPSSVRRERQSSSEDRGSLTRAKRRLSATSCDNVSALQSRTPSAEGGWLYKSRSSGSMLSGDGGGGEGLLGRVCLGLGAEGLGAQHWAQMMSSPRTPIQHTHQLQLA